MQKKHLISIVILGIFICLRLLYISTLPLIESESSDIRWGQIMVYQPDMRWASFVYPHKQPLPYWLFGIMTLATGNIVVAPRLVSLFFGLASFFVVYHWVRILADQETAKISLAIMAIIPLFIHFQSLALMESMVIFTVILSLWSVTMFAKTNSAVYALTLGIAAAIGFWTKTNTITSSILCFAAVGYIGLMRKPYHFSNILPIVLAVSTGLLFVIPLVSQPNFDQVVQNVSLYNFTKKELFRLPVSLWISNVIEVIYSLLIYGGPLFYLALIFCIRKKPIGRLTWLWACTLVLFAIPIIVNKTTNARYYLPALIPLLPILAVGTRAIFSSQNNKLKYLGYTCATGTVLLSTILIVDPRMFFSFFPDIRPLSNERGYALGWSSGYATREALKVLDDPTRTEKVVVIGVQDWQGNPSDYLLISYYFNPNRPVIFINMAKDVQQVSGIIGKVPVYFVTRTNVYHDDLLPYLEKLYSFRSPGSDDYVEIFRVQSTTLP